MAKGLAVLVGVKEVNPAAYNGWDGKSGCYGCELDAENMDGLLQDAGFETKRLLTAAATGRGLLGALDEAAEQAEPGDLFVFYYSGHGSRRRDLDGDELDGYDETLVLYDRQVLDDDLHRIWLKFKPGVRLVMISDCCHSGTNFRDPNAPESESAPAEPIASGLDTGFQAQMIHMSGCRDDQKSFGGRAGGIFTTALVEACRSGQGFAGYKALLESVLPEITTNQQPKYNEYGQVEDDFRTQSPFSLDSSAR
jgi:uncharacterized caspase-like protein